MKHLLLKAALPFVILAAGVMIGGYMYLNPEQARTRPAPTPQAALVDLAVVEDGTHVITIEAMGQIAPAQEIILRPQVGGAVIAIADEFIPGGRMDAGDTVLQIDPADYELAIRRAAAALKQAEADYALEMGRQSVARDEMAILERSTGKKIDNPQLALRGPQREQAAAARDSAAAELARAELDLARATVSAPFTALITERHVTAGDRVSAQQELARLVNIDQYWVRIAVPVDELRWLAVPGAAAVIAMDGGRGERHGTVIRQTGRLEPQSRLAELIVAVDDPLLHYGPVQPGLSPLVLGDYVRVKMTGRPAEGTVRVPLAWLRDGDRIWVAADGALSVRTLRIVHRDREYAYVADGLVPGEHVVISDLTVAVDGMKIRNGQDKKKTDETL